MPVSVLQSYVGFTLSHILGDCHSWRFTKRSQRWVIVASGLQVLQAALTCPLVGNTLPDDLGRGEPELTL